MSDVLRVADVGTVSLGSVLDRFGLELVAQRAGEAITGSYWGESEAGVIGCRVFVRPDTPVHSLLHEACHVICMDAERRRCLDRDAGGDDLEESAVCFLQILLADAIDAVGRDRLMADMDAWGYSFRLGSTRAWFERDADDAREFLLNHGLIDGTNKPTWRLRN
ncbi:MAG: hypothetical protein P8X94_02475 [Woeseiaceae bacterium]